MKVECTFEFKVIYFVVVLHACITLITCIEKENVIIFY